MSSWYAIALKMDGRYVDFQCIYAATETLAKRVVLHYLYPKYVPLVEAVTLGRFKDEEWYGHPCHADLTALEESGAFTRIGNDGETAIDEFVRKHFP
jgi:hypothetical protein